MTSQRTEGPEGPGTLCRHCGGLREHKRQEETGTGLPRWKSELVLERKKRAGSRKKLAVPLKQRTKRQSERGIDDGDKNGKDSHKDTDEGRCGEEEDGGKGEEEEDGGGGGQRLRMLAVATVATRVVAAGEDEGEFENEAWKITEILAQKDREYHEAQHDAYSDDDGSSDCANSRQDEQGLVSDDDLGYAC